MSYPPSHRHGGGSPKLSKLSDSQAEKKIEYMTSHYEFINSL